MQALSRGSSRIRLNTAHLPDNTHCRSARQLRCASPISYNNAKKIDFSCYVGGPTNERPDLSFGLVKEFLSKPYIDRYKKAKDPQLLAVEDLANESLHLAKSILIKVKLLESNSSILQHKISELEKSNQKIIQEVQGIEERVTLLLRKHNIITKRQ